MLWEKRPLGDDFGCEPFAEEFLPIVFFRGPIDSLIVAMDSGPAEGLREVGTNFLERVLDIVRPSKQALKTERAPIAFNTLSLKEFLERYPHPLPATTPYCVDSNDGKRKADWMKSAGFCVSCRERLTLVTALHGSPAVRIYPVR